MRGVHDSDCFIPAPEEYERRKEEVKQASLLAMRKSYGPTSPPKRHYQAVQTGPCRKSIGSI